MKNLFDNINVLEILRVGLSGLIFLLALLVYRLIDKEQQRPSNPRKGILRIIYIFMGVNVLSGIVVALAGYFQSPPTSKNNDGELTKAKTEIVSLTKDNNRYRMLMGELASTINAKVEYEAQQERGNINTLKPSINALVRTIETARREGLIDK